MTPGASEVDSLQHGGYNIHRQCKKENSNTAASGIRGRRPSGSAAAGGGHGEAGEGKGNTECL